MRVQSINQNLNYAVKVCSSLDRDELLELAILMSEENKSEEQETWATAIASVMGNKYPSVEEKKILMN